MRYINLRFTYLLTYFRDVFYTANKITFKELRYHIKIRNTKLTPHALMFL